MKPVVVHLVETYLGRSETFIHNYVASHVGWEPVVLCKFTANAAEFPVPRQLVVPAPVTKRDSAWWLNEAVGVVTGRSLWHRQAEEVLRGERSQVIHAHFGQQGFMALPLKRALGVPLITTFYGYDMSVLPHLPRWATRLARLFREGDRFLAEGPCMRQRLIELGAPAEKIRIQRIAIHPDRYPAWQPNRTGVPVVLFVGRFTEKKGLLDALAAVREVVRRGQSVHFRIVGDGPLRPSVEQFVAANGMAGYVEFLGMQPHPEVIRELTAANVFIHPSRTASNGDTEGGAPTIILEAQAVGVPIVTTRHADIPNVAPPGRGVFLSPEGEAGPLAENLWQALQGAVGADPTFVRAQHDVRREVLHLEAHYQELLSA
ncbi:MAG: glycosyl transferase, group 1 [Verrucomicrobiota bacterium]